MRKREEIVMEKMIAKDLLKIGAVFFRPDQPFTWASGIKSPVYCDNRLTLTAPEVRGDVENGLKAIVEEHYPDCQALFGTSTAGIEGKLEPGWKVVVIEDLISTGGSVIEVVDALREAGAQVLGIASIFTYGMKRGLERLEAAEVKNVSLTNFDAIAQVAAEEGYIRPEDIRRLIAFRDNPSDESWIGGAK